MDSRKHFFINEIKKLFDLRSDMDAPAEIESSIVQGINVRGTNLWILMFAILVASIGLNVNSTAVIIGAMLISPLMGPIMGIGYGAGVDNFELIRKSTRTLGVFVLLSLMTSTLYFSLTPLTNAQSELLARTSPNLWDVLIALFGGMAGIIGVTRREWGNVVPGVAIATALMPPLCTAGYGIATGQPTFFFGAFYLFTINAVYIALSALVFTRLLHLPRKSFASNALQHRARVLITTAIVVTLVPSIYLAVQLVRNELFKTQADAYLASISRAEKDLFILQKDVDPKKREISLTLAGREPDVRLTERLLARLGEHHLQDAKLVVRAFQQDNGTDLNLIKTQLQEDLYRNSLQLLETKNARIQELEEVIRNQRLEQAAAAEKLDEFDQVKKELLAQYPEFRQVYIAHGRSGSGDSAAPKSTSVIADDTLIVYIEAGKSVSAVTKNRIKNWMSARFGVQKVYVFNKTI